MTMANVIILCSLLLLQFVQSNEINKKLGTKTPYRFMENDDLNVGTYPGCVPTKIHMTIRHGTRYPNDDTITMMQNKLPIIRDEILKNHKESRGLLSNEQILEFEKWNPLNIPLTDEKILTPEGQDEMLQLGKRMHLRFNETIPSLYDVNKFQFKFTPTERTQASAKNFASGIFGSDVNGVVFNMTRKDDPVLRFYKTCRKWKQGVKKNPKTYAELFAYTKTPEMMTALKNVSNILGYENDTTFNTGKLIYVACAFETAWTKDYTSPWCYAFSDTGMEVMEYTEDLKYYWMDGYGYDINQRLACTLLRDVFTYFSDVEKSQSTFHFTHSGTVLMTLAHLGVYKDNKPLTHVSRDPNRRWKTSLMDGFGSNIGFVHYKCNDGDKLLMLHQERPVRFPECPNSDLCLLETIYHTRANSIISCDHDMMCDPSIAHEEL